jgi:hypothetical protein
MGNREILLESLAKSEDDFEKMITYISAGSLALSLTFIEKIVALDHAEKIWLLIVGWALLILTLLTNLLSHYYSKVLVRQTIYDLDNNVTDIANKITARNKKIDAINICCIFTLVIGLTLFVIFVSLNTIAMSKERPKQPITTKLIPDGYEKLGRTIPIVKPTDQGSSGTVSKPAQGDGKGK